jgi:hypothetical protein
MSIVHLELSGRPDGLRPGGANTTLELLRGRRQHGDPRGHGIRPQEWMELDREFAQFNQRRLAAMTAAEEAAAGGDVQSATLLYRLVASDSQHALDTIEFAAQAHPTGQLAGARADLRPAILAHRYIANAQLAVLASEFEGAVACLRTGIAEVTRLLGLDGVVDPSAHACVRDLRVAAQTIRARYDAGQTLSEQREALPYGPTARPDATSHGQST